MRYFIGALFISSLIPITGFSARYEICNGTYEDMHVAYGVFAQSFAGNSIDTGPVETQGWYPIAQGGCRDFDLAFPNQSAVLFYAQGAGEIKEVHVGDTPMCITPGDAFRHRGRTATDNNRCRGAGGTLLNFRRVPAGRYTFTDSNTYLKLCNNSPGTISYAHATFRNNSWTSEGWWNVDRPGECHLNRLGGFTGDLYVGAFVHGKINGNGPQFYPGGAADFCVDFVNSFKYTFADSRGCSNGNDRKLNFHKMRIGRGINTFTFHNP